MKLFLSLILIFQFTITVKADTINNKCKNILILNSYSEEVDWSSLLMKNIENKLNINYPDIKIQSHFLKSDLVSGSRNLDLILRSILGSLDNNPNEDTSPLKAFTIFSAKNKPDMLVIIGEEGFLTLQRYVVLLNTWRDIPIVLCAVNDSIINDTWQPKRKPNFNNMISIEQKNNMNIFISTANYKFTNISEQEKKKIKIVNNIVKGAMWNAKFNITGVKIQNHVKENLILINKLYPNLKELVWIDNYYYKTSYIWNKLQQEVVKYLPNVRLTSMFYNKINADSIYNVMLSHNQNRAYISFAWDIDALYSRLSYKQLDSLYTNHLISPLFSFSQHLDNDNYWIGGNYPNKEELTDKTVGIIKRILNGENPNNIPFETVKSTNLILNKTALKRYGINGKTKNIKEAVYVNIPLSFYKENEGKILLYIIVFAITIGIFVYWWRHIRFCKRIKKETDKYKRLYDKIQTIYNNAEIDFSLYDKAGDCIFTNSNYLLTDNIFNNRYLTLLQKQSIKNDEIISSDITTENGVYKITVKPVSIPYYQNARYIAAAIDLNPLLKERKEKELYENMFRFASDFSNIGIAYYNLKEDKFTATDSWYKNMNETFHPGSLPSYSSVLPKYRKKIIEYLAKAVKNNDLSPFCDDIIVIGDDTKKCWIRQNIFFNPKEYGQIIELNVNIDFHKNSENQLILAKLKADESNREAIEFIESISHEIRTPLNSIVGFSSVIASYCDDIAKREEYINIIKTNSKLLNNLIDNIFYLSRINSGKIQFKKELINIDESFNNLKNTAKQYLGQKQINILIECVKENVPLFADNYYLSLALLNLMSNAIKFTESGTITLGYKIHKGTHLIYVSDTGCGIEPKNHIKIFKEFEKLNTHTQGTGLGLPLCKSIIEGMGGSICVKSGLAEGSMFCIQLYP